MTFKVNWPPAARGYFAIGAERTSKALNLGNLMRSAHGFGAAFTFTVGATGHAPHKLGLQPDATLFPSGQIQVAVCGAHLSGLPLNGQLTARGARLIRAIHS